MDEQRNQRPIVLERAEVLHAWWRLRRLKGVGNIALNDIRTHLSTPEDLLSCSRSDLIALGLSASKADEYLLSSGMISQDDDFNSVLQWSSMPGQGVLLAGTGDYPEALSSLRDAPIFLWYRGNTSALLQPMVAIVGSRGATTAALNWAEETAATLAQAGVCVVSGLALGIDGAAHKGAVAHGRTVAVMGTGPDIIYPARHKKLAEDITRQGLLVTEFSPGTRAQARHFPSRNRIISGLSCATVVVEAGLRSGTMITARMAADQGRDVMALPGSPANTLSRGPHQLIREGAVLVEHAGHILEALNFAAQPVLPGFAETVTQEAEPSAETPELLHFVDFTPTPMDVIAIRSARAIQELLPELLQLELDGWLQQAPGGYCRQR